MCFPITMTSMGRDGELCLLKFIYLSLIPQGPGFWLVLRLKNNLNKSVIKYQDVQLCQWIFLPHFQPD